MTHIHVDSSLNLIHVIYQNVTYIKKPMQYTSSKNDLDYDSKCNMTHVAIDRPEIVQALFISIR